MNHRFDTTPRGSRPFVDIVLLQSVLKTSDAASIQTDAADLPETPFVEIAKLAKNDATPLPI